MSSGKATFDSRDPSSQSDGKATFQSRDPGAQPTGKATFESREPSRAKATFDSRDLTGPTDSSNKKLHEYMGLDRRRVNRRVAQDRREDVRFEFGKEDRRSSHGRRENDQGPDFW